MSREDFGVAEKMRAADTVTCRCEGCEPVKVRVEDVVRWQAEADDE